MVSGQAADLVEFAASKPSPAPSNNMMPTRSASIRKMSSSGSDGSPAMDQPPPAKKPRLKLNVKPRKDSDGLGDTIAVSRPKRGSGVRVRYSQDAVFHGEPESSKPADSPAPSSGLSSLSSAPPSEDGDREESPFKDPTPTSATKEDYGDFMSYYITGGDEEPQEPPVTKPKRGRPKSKPNADSPKQPKRPKAAKAPKDAKENKQVNQVSAPLAQPAPMPVQQPARPPMPLPPQPSRPLPPQQQGPPPPQGQQNLTRPQGPPFPGNQPHRPSSMPSGPPPPIIQYMDIQADPKPTQPDTIAIMIRKLESLSAALTNFGGVPAIPATPPPPPVEKPKRVIPTGDNPLDNFLSHFGGEDDDESEDRNFDYVLSNPGAADGPLTYGIQFIQNALKSWAQQRTTHQVTQQWQAQQAQMQSQVKRGPGRPKRYDDSEQHHVQPVIHMDLGATPEGIAIKAFQSVLDSGCLQVNVVLPIELSRALRHLYMQIDHLINQGSKSDTNWHCMSYGAQIAAHKTRLDKFKEAQAKSQEEMQRQQQQQAMGQGGMGNGSIPPMNAQSQHAVDLDRRRSEQYAAQQPYNSQPHLQPMQLASQSPGGPSPTDPAGVASAPATPGMPPNGPAGSPSATNTPDGLNGQPAYSQSGSGLLQAPSAFNKGSAAGRHLDKMKIYMPGYLPRSGQSMKFSFAPHNEAAVRVFGTGAFPTNEQGPNIPNRGPMMSAPPSQPSMNGNPANRPNSAPTPGDAMTPIDLDPDTTAEETFNGQASNDKAQDAVPESPAPVTGGFTAVNAPPSAPTEQRPSSVPAGSPSNTSPETIKVANRRPSGAASASASPAIGFKAVNKVNGSSMPSNFPHPGAIVVDQ